MVLVTTQSTSALPVADKENVVFKPAQSAPKQSNGRRQRSRPTNAVVFTREAAHVPERRSPPTFAPTRSVIGSDVEDPDVEVSDAAAPAQDSAPQRRVQLPRHLKRPSFRPIMAEAIEAAEPELREVSLDYIHQTLRIAGPQLFCVATNTVADPPRSRLPRELEVVINDISADAPTHLFAVYSGPTARANVHPVHALVLAAHCAHLPPLLYSKPATPSETGTSVTLPIVPLSLPSPANFPLLLHYLYTKRADHLLASLLPLPSQDASQSTEQLAQSLAATFTQPALLSHATKVHGLWSNVTALGVFDEDLWMTIEKVWEVMLTALAISTGATWRKDKQ